MWCLQAGLADITQSLKNYRPSVTVLEAQMAPSRRGEGAGATGGPGLTSANGPDGGLVAVMEQKRNAHDQAIKVSIHHCVYICKLGCFVSDLLARKLKICDVGHMKHIHCLSHALNVELLSPAAL